MKLFCNGRHWKIVEKKLVLDTPSGRENVQRAMAVIEAKVRLEIYEEIMEMDFMLNRKTIVKLGIDNVPVTVRNIIANKVLGK